MAETSLADKLGEVSSVKLKKATIKVPGLNAIKEKAVRQKADGQKKPNEHISLTLSSIVNTLIKAAIQRVKKREKGKQAAEENPYKAMKNTKSLSENRGYVNAAKGYEASHAASYSDYRKSFGNPGRFRANGQYEHLAEEHVAVANKSLEDSRFSIFNAETFDRVTSHIKYFSGGYVDTLSLVPKAGMNSAEWEQFRLGVKIEPVLYGYKTGRLLRL